jgi:beta-N-acetylhexosaminidase
MGVGGLMIAGEVPADLGARLARLRSAAAVPPLVASNEEGGSVQRLRSLIHPLPSAAAMGQALTPERIRHDATDYGKQMKALHVDADLAPDADLTVPGSYIAADNRAFSADPNAAGRDAAAFATGLLRAGVLPVVKHWPGHGHASDSHTGAARVPPLSVLERQDLRAFDAVFAAGAPAVMVGHLNVPGLTEAGLPTTLSPAAYRYLRAHVGPDTLVLTDSMSMGAATAAVGLDTAAACVRALQAGADMVVFNTGDPLPVIAAVAVAIDTGTYPRGNAVAAANRVLAAKRLVGE